MNVLIACEESGTVRDAFIKKGHNAISCDIIPTSKNGPHLQVDVLKVIDWKMWDLIIAHPPCTYLANSGVCHLDDFKNIDRVKKLHEASIFFGRLLNAPCEKICVENPIPHKYGIGKTYSQTIQPWQFGHPESKATCLWLKGLPNLMPTKILEKNGKVWDNQTPSGQNKLGPSEERSKLRSKTYQGIADAMADQWGCL